MRSKGFCVCWALVEINEILPGTRVMKAATVELDHADTKPLD